MVENEQADTNDKNTAASRPPRKLTPTERRAIGLALKWWLDWLQEDEDGLSAAYRNSNRKEILAGKRLYEKLKKELG